MLKPPLNNAKSLLRIVNSFVFRKWPIYVHYGITHRCNLLCRMCKIYQDANEEEELSLYQVERTFDFLKRLGVLYVSIGGGEPFLRKDLIPVIELIVRKGLVVRLLTNGTLVDEKSVKELSLIGLREVSVSLDTLDCFKQAYICNSEGVWEKTVHSIDLFSRFFPKNTRFLLINTVVSPLNIKELPELSKFAKKKGYFISFIPIESDEMPQFMFTQTEHKWIDESYDYLIKIKKSGKSNIFNSSLFLEKSRQFLKFKKCNWQCDAGKLYFSINPRGEFSICHRYKPSYRFLEKTSQNIIRSEGFRSYRESLVSKCSGCMRPCWAEVSFLFRNRRSLWEMIKLKLL